MEGNRVDAALLPTTSAPLPTMRIIVKGGVWKNTEVCTSVCAALQAQLTLLYCRMRSSKRPS